MIPTALHPFGRRRYDALVEYVESTGAQYVDTGVYDANPANIRYELRRSLFVGFGIASQNNAAGTWLGAYRVGTQYRVAWHNYNDRHNTTVDPDDQSVKAIVWDGGSGYYEEGAKLYSFIARLGNNGLAGRSWCLFGLIDLTSGTVGPLPYGGRVYGCALSRSGVLVRDFQPCRVGTAGALYDRVSGDVLLSATSTALVPGPDL